MKKIISKILIIFIIMVMLFEFTFSSNISYAFDSEDINSITNLIGGLVSFLLWIPRLLVTGVSWLMGKLMTEVVAESCGINPAFPTSTLDSATPFDIFFNKYNFLSVDFFNLDIGDDQALLKIVRTKVAEWFYILRTISAAILLVILIYVGIRMAISTIADDKAKYKKMLWDWFASLALIFVLQYIAIFTIEANNVIVNFLRDYGYNEIDQAITDIMWQAMGPMGIGALVSTFVYCMIIFQTISFMLVYIQRMLKVGFLILISPLISITYSIDKMGDGKAQALNKWLKEFVYTILIQPFHCIMYLAFVNTAMGLLSTGASASDVMDEGLWEAIGDMNQLANGFLAILCLKFINDGEKAIRKIFNFQDDGNMTSLAAGAAIGMAAISNAKKIGSSTAKGIHMAKGGVAKFGKAVGADSGKLAEKFKGSKFGQGIQKGLGKAGEKASQLSNAIKGNSLVQGAGKLYNGASQWVGNQGQRISKRIDQFKKGHPKFISGAKTLGRGFGKTAAGIGKGAKFVGKKGLKAAKFAKKVARRNMPLALGIMGAAMSYATGSSGVMEAIGVGSALNKGSEEFFSSTKGYLGEQKAELAERGAEMAYEQQQFEMDSADDAINAKEAQMSGEDNPPKKNGTAIQEMINDPNQIAAWEAKVKEEPLPEPPELADDASEEEKAKAKEKADAKKKQDDEKELAQLYLNRAKLGERPESKEAFVQAYLSQENIAGLSNTASHKKEDIEAKANVLFQKILEIKAEQKRKAGQVDGDNENILSDKDVSSADRAMKSITDSIDRSVIGSGGTMEMSKILQRSLGLENDGSEQYQAIMRAALDYRNTSIAARAADIDSKGEELEIGNDALNKEAHKRASRVSG